MKTILTVGLCILTLAMVIVGGSCSTKTTEPQVIIGLAPIDEMTINVLKTNPAQISVHIKGGLPDGCTQFNDIKTTRDGLNITVKVTTQHPKDAVCPAIYTWFEKDVNLGSDFAIGTTYSVKVNDQTATFTY
jgi:hypothetical protein